MDFKNREATKDEFLVEEVKKGNHEAGAELMRRYRPLVKKLCQVKGLGDCAEDLEQELWSGFFEIVQGYDERKAKFSTMAKALLLGKRKEFLRRENRYVTKVVALDETLLREVKEDVYPELEREECEIIRRDMGLSPQQQRVLKLLEQGYGSSVEIGRILGISQQCAHRYISGIRKKVKEILADRVYFAP